MSWLTSPLRAFQRWSGALADSLERLNVTRQESRAEPQVERRAARAQESTRAQQTKNLLRALEHRKPAVRVEAAQQIGAIGLYECIRDIIRATEDRHRAVRRAALGALWRMDAELFVDVAMKISRTDSRAGLLADLDAMVEVAITRAGAAHEAMVE
ncbi:HEAT repeat domain-containing protein [Myxococcota bacterium]